MFKKSINLSIIVSFIVSLIAGPNVHAAPLLSLPEPGKMVNLSMAYNPAMIKGVTINKDNPFLFDFIVDPGQDNLQGDALKQEGERQIKYFLAALTVPAKDLWVNLSPYEKDRTINEALGQTDMGRDLLAQDYILKQLTASLIYPEKELGKTFWNKVYAKTQAKFGDVSIPVNTFNKVWIMADQAEVYEHGQTAFVTKSHLKVMLEEDYLAIEKNRSQPGDMSPTETCPQAGCQASTGLNTKAPQRNNSTQNITSQIIRDVIIPELEREVNEGKNFAPLRQIFNAIILAGWYKNNLQSSLLNQAYADKSTVHGIDLAEQNIKEKIYDRYLEAYKKGVFNYVKEDATDKTPRKYFSGGVDAAMATTPVVVRTVNPSMIVNDSLVTVSAQVKVQGVRTSIKEELQRRMLELNNLIYSPQDLIDKIEVVQFIIKNNPYSLKPNKLALIIRYIKNLEDGEQGITKVEIRKFIIDLLLIIETEIVDTMMRSEQYMLKNNVLNKQLSLNLLTLKNLKNVIVESMNPADKEELDSGLKIEELWESTRPELASLEKTEEAEELDNLKFLRFFYALLKRGGNPAMLVEQKMNKDKVEEIVDLLMEIISDGKKLADNMVVKSIIRQVNNNEDYSDAIIEEAISHMLFFKYFLLDPHTLSLNESAATMKEPINAVKEFLDKFQLNGWETTVIEGKQDLSHVRKLSAFEAYLVEGLSRLINNMESGFQGMAGVEVNEGGPVEVIALGKDDIDITRPAVLSPTDSAMVFQRLRAYLTGQPYITSKEVAKTILNGPIKVQKDFKQYTSAVMKLVQEEPSWFLKKGNSGQVNFDMVIRKIKPGRVQGVSQNDIEQYLEKLSSTFKAAIIVHQQENKNFSRIRNLQFLLGKVEAIIQSGIDSSRGELSEIAEDRGFQAISDGVHVEEYRSTLPPDQAMTSVPDRDVANSFYPKPVGLTTPKEMIDDIAQFRLNKGNALDFTSAEWTQVEVLINDLSRGLYNNPFSNANKRNRPIDQMIQALIMLTKQPTRKNIERTEPYLKIWEEIFISDDLTIERKVLQVVKNMSSQYKSILNTFDIILAENSGEPFSTFEKSIIFEYLKGLVVSPNSVKLNENMEGKVNANERRLGTIRVIIKAILEIRRQGVRFEMNDEVKALREKISNNPFEKKMLNILRILLNDLVVLKYKKSINQGGSALLWFDENIALSDTLKSMGYSENLGKFYDQMQNLFNYAAVLIDFESLPMSQSRRTDNNQALKDMEYNLRMLEGYYIRNKEKYINEPIWNEIFKEVQAWLEKVRNTELLRKQLKTLNTLVVSDLDPHHRQDAKLFSHVTTKASNQAMSSQQGGIDLKQTVENTAVTKDGLGVQIQLDPAMLERIKHEGIQSLTPIIYRIAPVNNIRNLLGLTSPNSEENRLVGA